MSYTAIITIIAIILLLAVIALVYLLLKPQKSEDQIKAEIVMDGLIDKFNDNNEKIKDIEKAKEEVKNAKVTSRDDMVKLMASWK